MNEHHRTKLNSPGRPPARPTIGMFINSLLGLQEVQWLGALDAARAQQANLITFAGRERGCGHCCSR